jgi:hypothetical protein
MKTTQKVAAIGAVSVFAMVALLLAYPAMAAAQTPQPSSAVPLTGTSLASTSTGSTSVIPQPTALAPGQSLTFTSTNGKYVEIGNHSNTGTASGTVTFTATGAFKGGYALSITSGSLTLGTNGYTITSGSAEMGPYQAHLVGQGHIASTSSASNAGSFLVAAGAHANFAGTTYNTLRFDITVGGIEYGVVLLATVSISAVA